MFRLCKRLTQSLVGRSVKRLSSEQSQTFSSSNSGLGESVKLKKKPIRIFLAFLGLNAVVAFAWMKKVENDNRFSFNILLKLLEFKKQYTKDSSKYSLAELKKLFDEFLVENVAIALDEKHTDEIRKISVELCEKYPKEREFQLFASEISEYEKRAYYLKLAISIDRKYIDEVLIRQMDLNCQRYGQNKPFFYDEFYNACTQYSLSNKQEEAQSCLEKYMALNTPNYYRAAIQAIKNNVSTQQYSRLLSQVQSLLLKEKDLDQKEKNYILNFVQEIPPQALTTPSDLRLAAELLLDQAPLISNNFIKLALEKDTKDLHALSLQAKIFLKTQNTSQYNAIIQTITKINPKFLDSNPI